MLKAIPGNDKCLRKCIVVTVKCMVYIKMHGFPLHILSSVSFSLFFLALIIIVIFMTLTVGRRRLFFMHIPTYVRITVIEVTVPFPAVLATDVGVSR